jgi:hypothetical protein
VHCRPGFRTRKRRHSMNRKSGNDNFEEIT